MKLEIDLSGLEKFEKFMDQAPYKKALNATTKRMATRFRKISTMEVRKTYAIKAGDLKKTIKLKKVGNFTYKIDIRGKTLGLELFGARQTKGGVSVRVRKDRGRKIIKGAFLGRDIGGKLRIFKRKTKHRLPLKRFYTIAVPQMFNKDILNKAAKEVERNYEKEFEHNLDYYLNKMR